MSGDGLLHEVLNGLAGREDWEEVSDPANTEQSMSAGAPPPAARPRTRWKWERCALQPASPAGGGLQGRGGSISCCLTSRGSL